MPRDNESSSYISESGPGTNLRHRKPGTSSAEDNHVRSSGHEPCQNNALNWDTGTDHTRSGFKFQQHTQETTDSEEDQELQADNLENKDDVQTQLIEQPSEDDVQLFSKGHCLLLNYMVFLNGRHEQHSGKAADQVNKCLKEIGYEVHEEPNLSYTETKEALTRFSTMDHSEYGRLVCFILSHGKDDKIYCTDGKLISMEEVISFFRPENFPNMDGIIRLVFFSCCRGKRIPNAGYSVEYGSEKHVVTKGTKDLLVGFSTKPGCLSYYNKKMGSMYIYFLTEVFAKEYKVKHVLEMLIKTNEEMIRKKHPVPMSQKKDNDKRKPQEETHQNMTGKDICAAETFRQVGDYESSLQKEVYL